MKKHVAKVEREYGPFPGNEKIHGVSFDGQNVWAAMGDKISAFDPASGEVKKTLNAAAHAGTAFDGKHLWQIAENRIQKLDPDTGKVLATIPAPANGGDSGMAWAEGSLWVGEYRARKIHEVDPATGKVLRSIDSNRFVTGVTWLGEELWHATWEGDVSELRHIDAQSGEVLESVDLPAGVLVSGLESNGRDTFFCGGGPTGKVRAVRRPR
jgi:glutamine cyclotransferase